MRRIGPTPNPAPQYSRPASTVGSIVPRKDFAAGVVTPNGAAEIRAKTAR
jgi:hypothetical protein